MSKLPRPYSDKYLAGQGEFDLFKNKNADWAGGPFIPLFYIVLVIFVWGLLHVSQMFSFEDTWTVTNMVHGVVSHSCILYHFLSLCYLLGLI